MPAWCLVYVSVTFTVMRDGTSLNSGEGGIIQKSNVTHHMLYTRIRQLPRSGRVVTTGYPDPVPSEIPYLSHLYQNVIVCWRRLRTKMITTEDKNIIWKWCHWSVVTLTVSQCWRRRWTFWTSLRPHKLLMRILCHYFNAFMKKISALV